MSNFEQKKNKDSTTSQKKKEDLSGQEEEEEEQQEQQEEQEEEEDDNDEEDEDEENGNDTHTVIKKDEEFDANNDTDNKNDNPLSDDPLKCRMYEQQYPQINDFVVVEVKKIVDMGAYCSLLEYNNLEGMLLMTELQRKRIRSVKKAIRVGRQEILQVLSVNKEKGYIDLSRKRVLPEDIPPVEERWNKSKIVHSIIRQVAQTSNDKYSMLQLYQKFGFDLARTHGHIYDAFKEALSSWEEFIDKWGKQIPEDIRETLYANIEKRLKPQVVTVRATIEITCFTAEGVGAIKKALKSGLSLSTDEFKLSIKLVAPPLFTISINTLYPDQAKAIIQKSINLIHSTIEQSRGTLVTRQDPEILAFEG